MAVATSNIGVFVDRLKARLGDSTRSVPPSKLRALLVEARALLDETDYPIGRGVMHGAMALLLARLGRDDEALAELRLAVSQDRQSPHHLNDLAAALVRVGQYEEAIEYAREAREAYPPPAVALETWLTEAEANFRLGRAHATGAAFEQAFSHVDWSRGRDLLRLAAKAAQCDRDEDTAKFLALYLMEAQDQALFDIPDADVIRTAPKALLADARRIPSLKEAIRRILARGKAAVPGDP